VTWDDCHQPTSLKSKRETQQWEERGGHGEKKKMKKRKKMKTPICYFRVVTNNRLPVFDKSSLLQNIE